MIRELATLGLGHRCLYVRFFLGRETIRRLFDTGELQENPGKLVLHVVGQCGDGGYGLFQQAGHRATIAQSPGDRERKGCEPHHLSSSRKRGSRAPASWMLAFASMTALASEPN
jgi:hypothetical protein